MKVARVYKRTQVVCIVVDTAKHPKPDLAERAFESELATVTDLGWTTLDDSVRWMDA